MNGSPEAGLLAHALPASWAAEGRAMRRAIAADFAALAGELDTRHRDLRCASARRPRPLDNRANRARATYADRLRALARKADFTVLIAPETSGILAGLTRDLRAGRCAITGLDGRCGRAGGRQGTPGRAAASPCRSTRRRPGRSSPAPVCRAIRNIRPSSSRSTVPARLIRFTWPTPGACLTAALAMPVAVLQPFVPGTPMSASFLVGPGREAGRSAWASNGWRSATAGSSIWGHAARTVPRGALPQLKPAVEAVAGLRGFVGVDFIWNSAKAACHDPRDQPATDDFVRRAGPAAPTRPAGTVRGWPLARPLPGNRKRLPDWRNMFTQASSLLSGPMASSLMVAAEIVAHEQRNRAITYRGSPWISVGPISRPLTRTARPGRSLLRSGSARRAGPGDRRGRGRLARQQPGRGHHDRRALRLLSHQGRWASTRCSTPWIEGLPGWSIVVWGVDGEFHSVAEARRAAAPGRRGQLAGAGEPGGPSDSGDRGSLDRHRHDHDRPDPARPRTRGRAGRSDTERLQTGELVYAGVRRTPVCAWRPSCPVRGIATGLAAEIFASTLDVYLTLGDIESNPSDLSTADGRPATVEAARDRLARMVGADRDGFSAEDALAFARAADECLIDRLVLAAERAAAPTIGRPTAAVVAGSGEFLARRLAQELIEPTGPIIGLREAWGALASSAGCAYALVRLAAERYQHQGVPV